MPDHYFSQAPQSKSSPKTWQTVLLDRLFTFETDYGVFSKNNIDFGSRLLIEQFEEPDMTGKFLDFGCGYGPIGIAVAKTHPERHVILTDINERAIQLAQTNAQYNNVENVEFALSDRLNSLNEFRFAAILLNPPIRAGKQMVYQMFEDSQSALIEQGSLWVVIQKKQGAPSAIKKLKDLFNDVNIVARSKGYYILQAIKS